MPDTLTLRQIWVAVKTPGFRTQGDYLITTLTDAMRYGAAALTELYYRR